MLQKIFNKINYYFSRFYRKIIFIKAITDFKKLKTYDNVPDDLLNKLIFCWGNEGWSSGLYLLKKMLFLVSRNNGVVLECGSGLSTILIGIAALRSDVFVVSLENDKQWFSKVNRHLKLFGINNVNINFTPLKNYGEYSWYSVSEQIMKNQYSLVFCDGPPVLRL